MLIHYYSRCQVPDFIYLGPVEVRHFIAEKERIALLPFTLGFHSNGIKSQRALAGTGHTCKYDELSLRDCHINMFQVILGCAYDLDIVVLVFH